MTDFNDINGSSSALGEGSFKRRDELRRAEGVQRQKVKMAERLDRNINRAVRKGDARSADAFVNVRQAITGQAYGGSGGITSADDREQRVADGTLKGAKIRYDMGNIGATNNGMIAEAPPADSATPKNREGSMLQSPVTDQYGNTTIPDSPQTPGINPPDAREGSATPPVAPSAQTDPGGLAAKRAAVRKLRDKWTNQNKANDVDSIQAAYEAKMGDPADQAQVDREESFNAPAKDPVARKEFDEDRSLNDNLGMALQNANDIATAASERAGKVLAESKSSMDKYEIADKERIAKRDAGLAASEEKKKAGLASAELSDAAQKKMTSAYFNDVADTEARNAERTDGGSGNPMRVFNPSFWESQERLPSQPAPINRDTFDPANPPIYKRSVPDAPVAPTFKGPSRGKGAAAQSATLKDIDARRAAEFRAKAQADVEKARKVLLSLSRNRIPI